jgi:hypothetical protein
MMHERDDRAIEALDERRRHRAIGETVDEQNGTRRRRGDLLAGAREILSGRIGIATG